jgi:hypothetical protein
MADQLDPPPSPEIARVHENSRAAISRREFARRAALASAVASIAPCAAVAAHGAAAAPSVVQSVTQDPPPPVPPAVLVPQNPPANGPRLSAESQSEADARFQAILVIYGSRFSNEQKNDLHRLCAVVQPSLDHIRAYKIENGDGPALYLKPQYEREKKPKAPAAASAKPSAGQATPPAKSAPAASAPKKP